MRERERIAKGRKEGKESGTEGQGVSLGTITTSNVNITNMVRLPLLTDKDGSRETMARDTDNK